MPYIIPGHIAFVQIILFLFGGRFGDIRLELQNFAFHSPVFSLAGRLRARRLVSTYKPRYLRWRSIGTTFPRINTGGTRYAGLFVQKVDLFGLSLSPHYSAQSRVRISMESRRDRSDDVMTMSSAKRRRPDRWNSNGNIRYKPLLMASCSSSGISEKRRGDETPPCLTPLSIKISPSDFPLMLMEEVGEAFKALSSASAAGLISKAYKL
jgi:hypothetical protein